MALLFCSGPLPCLSPSHSSLSFSSSSTAIPVSLKLETKWKGVCVSNVERKGMVMVRASSEIDGSAAETVTEIETETKAVEAVRVDKLPLESKAQQLQEARLRMKLAKKIRLRRKRLVRKRKLRKKGRWPPSKMKKLKNV